MNMNPTAIMKMMNAQNKFRQNHPKFAAFLKTITEQGIQEGTVIEISVKKPNQEPIVSNMRVLQSDLDLLNELKEIAK